MVWKRGLTDTFSRLSVNNVENLQDFSGLHSVDGVKAILNCAVNQAQNREAWLPKINIINANVKAELLYTGGRSTELLTTILASFRMKMMFFPD